MIPIVEYDSGHIKGGGANAPDGKIVMTIDCLASDCTATSYTIEVLELGSGSVLATGKVQCTGTPKSHTLPLTAKCALTSVKVTLRFTCGLTTETDDDPSRIWIRNTT